MADYVKQGPWLAGEPFTSEQATAMDEGIAQLPVIINNTVMPGQAEQNLQLWQLQAALLATRESLTGWQGEPFIIGHTEVVSNVDTSMLYGVNLGDGGALLSGAPSIWNDKQIGTLTTGFNMAKASDGTWVAASATGIWTSHDSGATWTQTKSITSSPWGFYPATDDQGNWMIAYPDGNHYHYYYKSSDNGNTWTGPLDLTTATLLLNGLLYWNGHWIATEGQGGGNPSLVFSEDFGVSWTRKTMTTSSGTNMMGLYFPGGTTIWAWTGRDLLKSTDSGNTWTTLRVEGSGIYGSPLFTGTKIVLLAGSGGGTGEQGALSISSDGGSTWTTKLLPYVYSKKGRQIVESNSGEWTVLNTAGEIYVSTDGGNSWQQASGMTGILMLITNGSGVTLGLISGKGYVSNGSTLTWVEDTNIKSSTGTPQTGAYTDRLGHWFIPYNNGHYLEADSSTLTGHFELGIKQLDAAASSVYLLVDDTKDSGTSVQYQATLDGGIHWEDLTPGASTDLIYTGSEFALKATLTRPSILDNVRVQWLIGYAS